MPGCPWRHERRLHEPVLPTCGEPLTERPAYRRDIEDNRLVECRRGHTWNLTEQARFEDDEYPLLPDRFTTAEKKALVEAANDLDQLWDLDAARGMRDERPCAEYFNGSAAPKLWRMAGSPVAEAPQ